MQKDIIYKRFEYNKNLATGRAKALFAVAKEEIWGLVLSAAL